MLDFINKFNSIYLFFIVSLYLILRRHFRIILNYVFFFTFLITFVFFLKKYLPIDTSLSSALITCFWVYFSYNFRKYLVYFFSMFFIILNFYLKIILNCHSLIELLLGSIIGIIFVYVYVAYLENNFMNIFMKFQKSSGDYE